MGRCNFMWSVPITTEVVSLISLHMVRCTGYNLHVSVTCSRLAVFSGYFIQHYVIKFVSDLWQVYGLWVIFGRLVLCQWLLAGWSFSQGNSIHYVIKLKLIVCNLWLYIWYMALAWWLVPCLPFPGLPHIYFLFTVRLTNERVGVFLARHSVQHLVLIDEEKISLGQGVLGVYLEWEKSKQSCT
jgi:hypothetical protein